MSLEIKSDFAFDFGQVQKAPEVPQFRACCHGPVQILEDIAKAIREGNASREIVSERLSIALDKLPTTITTEDGQALTAGFKALNEAMVSKPGFAEAQKAVAFSESVVNLHVQAAQYGPHPTPQQSAQLGEMAMKVNALAQEQVTSSNASPVFSEVQARAESYIKQAQDANPLFGLTMTSASTPEVKPQIEPAKTGSWNEPTKDAVVEQKPSAGREVVKTPEVTPKERTSEAVKVTVPETVKVARSEVSVEPRKPTSEPQVQRVETVERRQASSVDTTVAKVVAPAVSSPAPVQQQVSVAPSSSVTRSVSPPSQPAAPSVSQRSAVQTSSGSGVPSSVRSGAVSSSARIVTPSTVTGSRAVQRVAPGGSAQVRAGSVARTGTIASTNSASTRAGQVVRTAAGRAPGEQIGRSGALRGRGSAASQAQREQSSQRLMRGARPDGVNRIGREKGISPEGRVVVNARVSLAPPVQRIATMLAQLRALSPKELKAIRLGRHDRPNELQMALAIRDRVQKIVERIKGLPLKELVKMKDLKIDAKTMKGVKKALNPAQREMLARREVRFLIRDLAVRLQSFINPRSMLFKRLTTELTLADLERLVSMLGGNRAVRGLRKKHKAGEVTQVFESDISNSFLSQLASAAYGPAAGGDAGGSDESSPATGGAGVESGTEASTEETTLVADGAVPTATLSTFIMKEETVGNSM
jgi:hypothetical protein